MPRSRQMVVEKRGRWKHRDPVLAQLIRDRSEQSLRIPLLHPRQDHQHPQVRPKIEQISRRNLSHHHRLGHPLAQEELDHLP